jgi:hypothetical protein
MSVRCLWQQVLFAILVLSATTLAQTQLVKRNIVVNGHSGEITIYRVDGIPFVDLQTLVKIGNGTVNFQGETIVLTFNPAQPGNAAQPGVPSPAPDVSQRPSGALSPEFMNAAVQALGVLKQWRDTMAYGITRGIPGGGTQMTMYQNRATEQLRLAQVAAKTEGDQSAYALVARDFENVNNWYKHLKEGRENMSTGNYSMSEDPLKNDAQYQKIVSCSDFLGRMIPGGTFSDDGSCH